MTDEHLTDGWEPDLPVADTLLRPPGGGPVPPVPPGLRPSGCSVT